MTDRIHSVTVVLNEDLREDDCCSLVQAIGMLRGVLSVSTHVSDVVSNMAQVRARAELGDKIWAVIFPKAKP